MLNEIQLNSFSSNKVSAEMTKMVVSSRNKKRRLRAIFLRLRGFKVFEDLSDLCLLTGIVNSLKINGLSLSKKEIYSAFAEISKNDYEKSQKRQILKDLLSGAKCLSIFA